MFLYIFFFSVFLPDIGPHTLCISAFLPCSLSSLPFSVFLLLHNLLFNSPNLQFLFIFLFQFFLLFALFLSLSSATQVRLTYRAAKISETISESSRSPCPARARRPQARWSVIKCFISPYCLCLKCSRGLRELIGCRCFSQTAMLKKNQKKKTRPARLASQVASYRMGQSRRCLQLAAL